MSKSESSNSITEAGVSTSLVKTAIKSSEEAAGKAAPEYSAKIKKLMAKIKILLQRKAVTSDRVKILKKKILNAGVIRDQIKNQTDSNPEWVKANAEFMKLVKALKVEQGQLDKDSTMIDRLKAWNKKRAETRAWDDEQDLARKKWFNARGRRYTTRAELRSAKKNVALKLGGLIGSAGLLKISKNRIMRKKKCQEWSGNKQLCNLIVDLASLKEVHTAISQAGSHVRTPEEKSRINQMLNSNMEKQNGISAKIAEMKKAVKTPIKESHINKSEVKPIIAELIKESGCSSIDEYIIHLL